MNLDMAMLDDAVDFLDNAQTNKMLSIPCK